MLSREQSAVTLLLGDGADLSVPMETEPVLSPFWGTGGVAGGDAGLHAVRALQAQGVVRLAAAGGRLVVQDGVMHCGRYICGEETAVTDLQCPLLTETRHCYQRVL